MALTAAGTGHSDMAVLAGGICAATLLFALMLLSTTVHRDHLENHNVPSLLNDTWSVTPSWARERGAPQADESHRMG
ncbi:hypothetical protein HLB23_05040 [Nocardia uniformis]|uniref:Uncharacterized protein n=1 Tax=Nocardia uniformis TaxID=53432 RepID=A0A849BY93_9NOCA|nr:hypothetical protein [Nocardia uniformis]NNH69240.1 hypothetical protein [Nocardia uniformis]